MNFQFYLEKLFASQEFENFKKEHPEAFLCSGFFSIDKQGKDNKQHLDYFIPSLKKYFSFKLDQNPIELMLVEEIAEEDLGTPERISDNYNFHFDEVEKLISERMEQEKIKNEIHKIIFSLQNKGKKDFLIGTVFLSGLGIIKVLVNLQDKSLDEFEKKSFFEMVKVIKK
jgi:hypothetical protein